MRACFIWVAHLCRAREVLAESTFGSWLEKIDTSQVGIEIAGMFVTARLLPLLMWRLGRVKERWTARLQQATAS